MTGDSIELVLPVIGIMANIVSCIANKIMIEGEMLNNNNSGYVIDIPKDQKGEIPNVRSIRIKMIIPKIINVMEHNRIIKIVESRYEHNIMGNRPNHGCNDSLTVFKEISNYCIEKKHMDVLALSTDVKK